MTNSTKTSAAVWTARVLGGLVILFLVFDGGIKLIPIQPVIDTMQALGFNTTPELARGLGVLLLACTALYAVPRTSVLGAILLTGYLGGAIAIQLRAGNPVFSHLLFGTYVGALMWASVLIRKPALRAVLFG